jgi:hypothetical protein
MSEPILQVIEASKVLWAGFGGLLYGLGGTALPFKSKVLRRYLASAWIALGFGLYGMIQMEFSWWYALCYPLFIGAFSIGYGAVDTKTKILKRLRTALAILTASLPVAYINGAWLLCGVHAMILIVLWQVLGVINPINARAEETIFGTTAGLLPLYFIS